MNDRRTRVAAGAGLLAALLVGAFVATRRPGTHGHGGGHGGSRTMGGLSAEHAGEGTATRPPPTLVPIVNDHGEVMLPGDASTGAGAVLFSVGWGSGEDQLGRTSAEVTDPEAPMSFTIDAQGNILVLDQVNRRLVRYAPDGRRLGTVPLQGATAQDVSLGRDGSIAVLDRRGGNGRVSVLTPDGRSRGDLPLPVGDGGVMTAEQATAVVVQGDRVYVERENGPLIPIGNTNGQPHTRRPGDPETTEDPDELPGRLSRDGSVYVSAGLVEGPEPRFWLNVVDRATQDRRFTREYQANLPLQSLMLVDTDRSGIIYVAVAASLPHAESTPEHGTGESAHSLQFTVRLYCIEPLQGRLVGQAVLPFNNGNEATLRDLAVLDEGGVIYSVRTAQGTNFQRFDCQ